MLFPLDGSLDWNLVRRSTIRREPFTAWSTQYYTVNSPNLIVGTGIEVGRPGWRWAGQLVQFVPTKPDSNGVFGFGVEVVRWPVYIGHYQHFKLADYGPRPYTLRFIPAKLLTDITVEMWWYDGVPAATNFGEQLDRIEDSIDASKLAISNQLNQIEIQLNQS